MYLCVFASFLRYFFTVTFAPNSQFSSLIPLTKGRVKGSDQNGKRKQEMGKNYVHVYTSLHTTCYYLINIGGPGSTGKVHEGCGRLVSARSEADALN